MHPRFAWFTLSPANWTRAVAALLSLFLAGPALATPLRSNDAADPALTESPAGLGLGDRLGNRKSLGFSFGVGLLGGAVAALALGFGMGGQDLRKTGQQLDARLADIMARGGRTPTDDFLLALYERRLDGARDLMIASAVVATVFTGVGAGLLSWSLKGITPTRARLNPYGGPQGGGLSIVGRF